ncbi:MAG TPA: hypothetical protein VIL01_00450 [Thermomicrobiales bacterium]|jgi:hypothetical protein
MGRWVENDAAWYEQRMLHCQCCGRMIAKHIYREEVGGAERTFCGEECAQLYRDYVLPERGENYRPPADVMDLYDRLMVK